MAMVRTSSIVAVFLTALILAGCGGESKDESKSDAGTDTAVQPDARTTSTVSAGQLDFFTERYISAEERLLRRQNRIEEALSGSAASGQS